MERGVVKTLYSKMFLSIILINLWYYYFSFT